MMSVSPRSSSVPSAPISRHVRSEAWKNRCFYASPCRFFIDVPLDMTGCIQGAIREAMAHGFKLSPQGEVLATEALFRGAVLIEIEDPGGSMESVYRVAEAELLARDLPERAPRLRQELDELVRWATELGHEVHAVFIRYSGVGGAMRPTMIYGAL